MPRQRVRCVAPQEGASTVPEQQPRAAFESRALRVRFRAPCRDSPAGSLGAPRAKSERLRRVRVGAPREGERLVLGRVRTTSASSKSERLAHLAWAERKHRMRDRPRISERAHAACPSHMRATLFHP